MIADILIGAVCGLSVFTLGYIVGTVRREHSWQRFVAENTKRNLEASRKLKDERNKRRRELRAQRARERMDKAFEQSEADRRDAERRMP